MNYWLTSVAQLDGLIIQAFGVEMSQKKLLKTEILCQQGLLLHLFPLFQWIAEPVYAYEGGGICLQNDGVYFVKELNVKKRLKLLIAINAGLRETTPSIWKDKKIQEAADSWDFIVFTSWFTHFQTVRKNFVPPILLYA